MDHDKQNPPTNQDTDLSKAQNEQQPFGQQSASESTPQQQPPEGQSQQQPPEFQSQQQVPEGQADYGNAGQSDTTTQQRSDIEGGTSTGQATDIEGSSTFVGAQGDSDTSSELIEDENAKDRRGDGE